MTQGKVMLPGLINQINGRTVKQLRVVEDNAVAIEFTDGTAISFVPLDGDEHSMIVSLWGVTDFEV